MTTATEFRFDHAPKNQPDCTRKVQYMEHTHRNPSDNIKYGMCVRANYLLQFKFVRECNAIKYTKKNRAAQIAFCTTFESHKMHHALLLFSYETEQFRVFFFFIISVNM